MASAREELAALLSRREPTTWLFVGDSITQGAVHTLGMRDYTQLFRERLGELARNEDVVINTAVGGWSSAPLVERFDERVSRFRPDALFVMFGTNDAVAGEEGLGPFRERLAEIVRRSRALGDCRCILQTTVPMAPVDPEAHIGMIQWPDEKTRAAKLRGLRMRLRHLESYASATRETASSLGVPCIDHWGAFRRSGGRMMRLLDGGFHPSEYGHRLIAHTIFRECGIWDPASLTCRLFVPVDLAP